MTVSLAHLSSATYQSGEEAQNDRLKAYQELGHTEDDRRHREVMGEIWPRKTTNLEHSSGRAQCKFVTRRAWIRLLVYCHTDCGMPSSVVYRVTRGCYTLQKIHVAALCEDCHSSTMVAGYPCKARKTSRLSGYFLELELSRLIAWLRQLQKLNPPWKLSTACADRVNTSSLFLRLICVILSQACTM